MSVDVAEAIMDTIRYTATATLLGAKFTRTVTEFLPLNDQATPSAETSRLVTEFLLLLIHITAPTRRSRIVTAFF